MIRERVMAGLSRARADGIQLGRRRLEDSDADKVAAIVAARAKGTGIRRIARMGIRADRMRGLRLRLQPDAGSDERPCQGLIATQSPAFTDSPNQWLNVCEDCLTIKNR